MWCIIWSLNHQKKFDTKVFDSQQEAITYAKYYTSLFQKHCRLSKFRKLFTKQPQKNISPMSFQIVKKHSV